MLNPGSLSPVHVPLQGTQGRTRPAHNRFWFGLALAMALTVFIGFGPSFYLNRLFAASLAIPPVGTWPVLLIVHGLLFTAWMLLLVLQTGLAVMHHVAWHRRLGLAGAVLAAAMVVVGIMAQLAQTRRMLVTGEFHRNFVLGPGVFFQGLLGILVFAALAGAALHLRRQPEMHKRLLMLATMAIVGAATARIAGILGAFVPGLGNLPYLSLLLADLFLLALVAHDFRISRRLHPATLWGGLFLLATQVLMQSPLVGSPMMNRFAEWIAG